MRAAEDQHGGFDEEVKKTVASTVYYSNVRDRDQFLLTINRWFGLVCPYMLCRAYHSDAVLQELFPLANGGIDAGTYEGMTKNRTVDCPLLERRVVSSTYFQVSCLVLNQVPIL